MVAEAFPMRRFRSVSGQVAADSRSEVCEFLNYPNYLESVAANCDAKIMADILCADVDLHADDG